MRETNENGQIRPGRPNAGRIKDMLPGKRGSPDWDGGGQPPLSGRGSLAARIQHPPGPKPKIFIIARLRSAKTNQPPRATFRSAPTSAAGRAPSMLRARSGTRPARSSNATASTTL